MTASAQLAALRRVCPKCSAVHYATRCHICEEADPAYAGLYAWTARTLTALKVARPAQRIVRLVEGSLASIGLAIVVLAVGTWLARDDLAAWYRTLPVVVAAKFCPGNEQ